MPCISIITFRCILPAILALITTAAGCGSGDPTTQTVEKPQPRATFLGRIDWIGQGVWLKADTHIHTKFSDGGVSLADVVQQGVDRGCDVLAITDHADNELAAASHEYFEAIDEARRKHPKLILLAGLEWNVPPWKGDEHATLLASPGKQERKLLADFKTLFDDWKRRPEERDPDMALHALRWLASQSDEKSDSPLLFYNHPSRKREKSDSIATELAAWRKINRLTVGFEGAPGHQEMVKTGAYKKTLQTIDRWDPAVATLGDGWDQLLQQGDDVWAALATSDFHNANPAELDDYWPGEFSETWLYAPDRTARGALAALRAGTFFAAHGHIAREVMLEVSATGLPRPAVSGESISVPAGLSVDLTLRLKIPATDWRGEENRIDEIELIVVAPDRCEVAAKMSPGSDGRIQHQLIMTDKSLAIRARGRRIIADGPDLLFYTNPVRVVSEPKGQTE